MSALIGACGLLIVASNAAGQTWNDPPSTLEEVASGRQSMTLLRQGRIDDLDTKMSALQRSYETGAITDEHLMHEFRAFYDTDAGLLTQYNSWIAKHPDSYVAYLARGIYYRELGATVRGSRYAGSTTVEQMSAMSTYLQKGAADLAESIPLTVKPLLSYQQLIGIGMMAGDRDTTKKLYDNSVHIDPKNFVARYAYLVAVQTRWGGSLDKMVDCEREAREAGLSTAQLQYFLNLIAAEVVWLGQQK